MMMNPVMNNFSSNNSNVNNFNALSSGTFDAMPSGNLNALSTGNLNASSPDNVSALSAMNPQPIGPTSSVNFMNGMGGMGGLSSLMGTNNATNNASFNASNLQKNSDSSTKNDKWIGNVSGQGDPYAENGILGPWSAFSAGLLGNMAVNTQDKSKKARKKPKDKPKRPLSAYNIFFKEERSRILEEIPKNDSKDDQEEESGRKRKKRPHGKIGFESLAKVIGKRWKELPPEKAEYYKKKASEDMLRYKREMEVYVAKGAKIFEPLGGGSSQPTSKKQKLDEGLFKSAS